MQALPQIPQKILEIHKTAVDNIRFLKGQQWLVTNFVTALNGVLFVIAVDSETTAKLLLTALTTLVALGGVLLVVNFQSAIHQFRQRCNWIYEQYYTDHERQALNLLESSQSPWTRESFMSWNREPFILMVAVMVGGWAVGLGFVINWFGVGHGAVFGWGAEP